MPTTLENTLEIACPPERLYAYVTQPWLWHEWHPNSKGCLSAATILGAGDRFTEEIELQPLSPLPFTMRRITGYLVEVADPPRRWAARGETRDGWLSIQYECEPSLAGTLFTRRLCYETRGASRWLMPLLKPRMVANSRLALERLKQKMETSEP